MILDKIESKGPSIEGFTPVFLDIIRPFYGRISVDFIREWQVFLDKGSLNKEEIQKMVNTGKAFLTKEAATYNHNDRLWAETMIFISLYRLNDRLVEDEQMPWPLDFDTNNSGSIPSLILTKVTELYNLWRVEPEAYPCARAYAYCLAVEGALGIKLYEHQTKSSKLIKEGLSDVRMKEFDPFRDYLNCAFIGTGQFASNYLSRFVIDYTVNRSPAGASLDGQSYIEHYKLIDLGRVKLNKDRISVMMVGLSGSGKTSIIKGLYEAIYRGGYNNSPLKQLSTRKDENTVQANQAYKFLNRAVGTREDVYILEGEITINERQS
jgi:hypothetical protein